MLINNSQQRDNSKSRFGCYLFNNSADIFKTCLNANVIFNSDKALQAGYNITRR